MQLIVGTGSTWSLRVWICLQLIEVKATEQVIDLSSTDHQAEILKYSPSGLVPAFIDGNISINDSLAIIEHLNEHSQGGLYPTSVKQRACARSLCAEMHAGFPLLREQLPFMLTGVQTKPVFNEQINQELARVEAIFETATLPYMFEFAGAVDAFYAILAFRLDSYGITLPGKAGDYQKSLLTWDLLKNAIKQAEHWESITIR